MLEANFWQNKQNSKKILKEKKLYENLFNSHKQIQNEIKDSKDILDFNLDGYKYNTLLGRRFIRTIKTDILRRGNIYGFAAPQFLGCFYVLNNTKFYVDKVGNKITFWCWEDIGMAFLNLNSLIKMELYSGSVTPGHLTAGSEIRLPQDEEELGRARNRADDGFQSPIVTQF